MTRANLLEGSPMEGNIGLDFTSKIIKFPAVFRLQDKAQFPVQFPTHVLKITGQNRKSDNLQKVRKSAVYNVPGVNL